MAERHAPVRTCIGCRSRAPQGDLQRWVLASEGGRARIVPDDRGILPGRGAWLHDSEDCRQLAIRRRAFRRALRIAGDVEVDIGLDVANTERTGQHVAGPERHTEGTEDE